MIWGIFGVGVWLIIISFITNARGLAHVILFKIFPFFQGLFLMACVAIQKGWIIL
jgi:hypothetical protein